MSVCVLPVLISAVWYESKCILSSSSSSCRAASIDIPDPLSTSPYHSSPPAGLQGYIPYHHIAAV